MTSRFDSHDGQDFGANPSPMSSPLQIHYEDNHHLVVEKVPNLLSQADITERDDVLTMMKAYLVERDNKPGDAWLALAHRLDYPVGGLLLLAKTSKAASRLAAQMRDRTIERLYVCVVQGKTPEEGSLENWLLKDRERNITRAVSSKTPQAKFAALHYWRIAYQDGKSLLVVKLGTGRSHQIRVQFQAAGFPLHGDRRYGREEDGLALFASGLSWEHVTLKEARQVIVFPQTGIWQAWQAHRSQVIHLMETLLEQGS